jgi:ATP-dependent RNA helicase HelY
MSEELSPAERYRLAKKKSATPELRKFSALLEFPLDPFQEKACAALELGKGVLVAAPTGAGKTIVGEFAIHLALANQAKVFYTTPIKALSNQKYTELVKRYGPDRVGLLTGDNNTNSDAQIVVMTTEVLRNMIYANSDALINLSYVIMDEVHYLADRFRGAVWEEVILHLPADVRVVSLSATVSNAEEFGAWLDEVRGDTEIIVSEIRPVPLNQHVLFGDELVDLFDRSGSKVNPELTERHNNKLRAPNYRSARPKHGRSGFDRNMPRIPKISKAEIIDILEDEELLPAIFFIFSRVACDTAVRSCIQAGVRLTTNEEREEIRRVVEEKCYNIADEDLATLGYFEWRNSLERGVAAHHAGMLPAFKETVEELFLRKLVKVVFATETLALGINMPARTVVLDKLDKFNGDGRVQITAGEYTQLTGRAGRRGIDTIGHSVIQWSGNLDPASVAGLASKRTYPLNSSFRPTYNMAVNLIDAFGRERARTVLETSFAQFQADRSVVGLAKTIREREISLAGYSRSMECHLGDFASYAALRREISDIEKALNPIRTREARGKDIRAHKGKAQQEARLAELKRRMKAHACHNCHEREAHARWGERWYKLRRETDDLLHQIDSRTNQVAKTFDRICEVLAALGYLERTENDDFSVAESGRQLARIYGERDLLVSECINSGAWSKLDASSLAAMVAALVYEPRRDDEGRTPKLPKGEFAAALAETEAIWDDIEALARAHKIRQSEPIHPHLAFMIHRWCSGARLDSVLDESELLVGDFVRWCKQIIDLLGQIAQTDSQISSVAREAIDRVKRGIVAYSYFN